MECYFIVDTYIDENKGRKALEECFASEAYESIMKERIESVDARALIVEGNYFGGSHEVV